MGVKIYDTTLRDGTQAEGIAFNVEAKVRVAKMLDDLGIHYLEGGWPGSNPNSIEFFERIRSVPLKHIRVAAFGSTRHKRNTPARDPNIRALLETQMPVVTIFGKSWDLHVRDALRVSLQDNLAMISSTVAYLKKKGREVIYDAEHFFDGFKANPEYALSTLDAAAKAGADCLVLCETNGGAIPSEVAAIVREVRKRFPEAELGIHTHNDSGCGVANALAAVEEGANHVQGTINGYGERCGNANLIPIIANLELKMNRNVIGKRRLRLLTPVSRGVDELANQIPDVRAPFVGSTAFAHKGGIHVSAVLRNARCYEHVEPEAVGNRRRVLISDQSGRANLAYKIGELGLDADPSDPEVAAVLREVKELENRGYEFESAEASFILMLEKAKRRLPLFFENATWRILNESIDGENFVLGIVKVTVDGKEEHAVAEGDGPVNALDLALRRALSPFFPELSSVHLVDYNVRVLNAQEATAAAVRVLILSSDGHETWGTVGVSPNIIDASWRALTDSLVYFLWKRSRKKTRPRGGNNRTRGGNNRPRKKSRRSWEKETRGKRSGGER
ncbi:MAG: citramalate synthase [Candidatus Hydrogenedentota bacterium]|nr:MAG: citramalate synthase [Candidatus Hydrogenedentota bacterium]